MYLGHWLGTHRSGFWPTLVVFLQRIPIIGWIFQQPFVTSVRTSPHITPFIGSWDRSLAGWCCKFWQPNLSLPAVPWPLQRKACSSLASFLLYVTGSIATSKWWFLVTVAKWLCRRLVVFFSLICFLVPYRIVLCKLQPQTKSKLDGLWRLGCTSTHEKRNGRKLDLFLV